MKCKFCKKEIDVTKNEVPPTWFGKYVDNILVEITCLECLKKNRDEWRKEFKCK